MCQFLYGTLLSVQIQKVHFIAPVLKGDFIFHSNIFGMICKIFIITILMGSSYLSSAQVVEIWCGNPVELNNNKVGHDWSFSYELASKLHPTSQPLSVSISKASLVNFYVLEADEVYPEFTLK